MAKEIHFDKSKFTKDEAQKFLEESGQPSGKMTETNNFWLFKAKQKVVKHSDGIAIKTADMDIEALAVDILERMMTLMFDGVEDIVTSISEGEFDADTIKSDIKKISSDFNELRKQITKELLPILIKMLITALIAA